MDNGRSFSVGLKALILNPEGKMLLIKRSRGNTLADTWDIPGGRMQFGESLREALQREMREETGLELDRIGIVLNVSTFFPGNNPDNQIVRIVFAVSTKPGEVILSDEHQDTVWVDPSELASYQLYSPVVKMAVEEFGERLGTGELFSTSIAVDGFVN